MDVLRAAQGRLDAVDYGAVKGAWLDAQRLQLVSASLRATPAETRACADALLQALPALHADATPAAHELARRAATAVLDGAPAAARGDEAAAQAHAALSAASSAAAARLHAASEHASASHAAAAGAADARAAAGASVFSELRSPGSAVAALNPRPANTPPPPQTQAKHAAAPARRDEDESWSDDDGSYDPYGGEAAPAAGNVLASARAALAKAAAPDATTADFAAASAARRAEYSAAGHGLAGPARGAYFSKTDAEA